jgi:phenylpyruvate tautomerase
MKLLISFLFLLFSSSKAIGFTRYGVRSMVMMPTLLVQTSVSIPGGNDKFLKDATSVVAKGLGKPEQYVMISLKKSDAMSFGGSFEPCAFCHLASIGKIDPSTNRKMSEKICNLLKDYFNIESNRVYIQFFDSEVLNFIFRILTVFIKIYFYFLKASNFGFDGSTF